MYKAGSRKRSPFKSKLPPVWRQHAMVSVMVLVFVGLALKVIHLHTIESDRLQSQGDKRYLRQVTVLPERGKILDRNGQILALSTPVKSLAAEPEVFCRNPDLWRNLPQQVGFNKKQITKKCRNYANSSFMYIKRRLAPSIVSKIMQMDVPGLEVRTEFKRFYPGGVAGAHLIGFTNVDNKGQEGLELAYDKALAGKSGSMYVLKDLGGHYVERVDSIRPVLPGEDLIISIDQRIQSLASKYLQATIEKFNALSGSVVVIGVPSGEIISMVTTPQYNPNDRSSINSSVFRNRTVTDMVEPGSTVKPFTIAMGLQSGRYTPEREIDTELGVLHIGGHTIHDIHNYGKISVSDVIVYSSNVGSAKIALSLPFSELYSVFQKVGFGQRVVELPGEALGILKKRSRQIEHATMAYGYGFLVTPLQLARAYTVFATDGKLLSLTLDKKPEGYSAPGVRVFDPGVALAVRNMLEQVATPKGTARKAQFPRYRVGGKTGTTHKLIDGNYLNSRYVSQFAGMAPISDPRFVIVVTINDPRGGLYYGGDVAAPVFSSLMEDLVRLYNIEPDDISDQAIVFFGTKTKSFADL